MYESKIGELLGMGTLVLVLGSAFIALLLEPAQATAIISTRER